MILLMNTVNEKNGRDQARPFLSIDAAQIFGLSQTQGKSIMKRYRSNQKASATDQDRKRLNGNRAELYKPREPQPQK